MPIERIGYSCEYCPRKRIYSQKSKVIAHEKRCVHNPAVKACATCKHYACGWTTVYVPSPDPGSLDEDIKVFFCNHPDELIAKEHNPKTDKERFDSIHKYNCKDHEIRPSGWVMLEESW